MLAHTAAFEIEILPPKIVHQSEMRQSSLDIQHRGTVAIRNVCVIARWLTVKLVLLQLFCHVIAVCVCVFVRCMKCYTHTHTQSCFIFSCSPRVQQSFHFVHRYICITHDVAHSFNLFTLLRQFYSQIIFFQQQQSQRATCERTCENANLTNGEQCRQSSIQFRIHILFAGKRN